jgi:hypothetical protein
MDMRAFLKDFESGKLDGRYVVAALPALPFENGEFGLSLCSHFLLFIFETVRSQIPPRLFAGAIAGKP